MRELSPRQAAEEYHLSIRHIRRLCVDGAVSSHLMQGAYGEERRIDAASLEAYLAQRWRRKPAQTDALLEGIRQIVREELERVLK